jgi:hypothetical protein
VWDSHGKLFSVKYDNKWGFFDMRTNLITPCKFDEVKEVRNGLVLAKRDYIWYIINKEGVELSLKEWTDVDFSSKTGFLAVKNNNDYGYVYIKSKNMQASYVYDNTYGFHEGLAAVKRNGKWGFIYKNGTEIIVCEFDEVRDFYEGLAEVKKKGKYGLIDKVGKEVIPCDYDLLCYTDDYRILCENHFSLSIWQGVQILKKDKNFYKF